MKEYSAIEKILMVKSINEIQRTIFKFKKENGYEPSNEEISKILNIPIEKIIEIKEFVKSLDGELDELLQKEHKFYNYSSSNEIKITNQEEYNNLRNLIIKNKNVLKDREKEVLFLRFGINEDKNYTIKDIALKLGISKSLVRNSIEKGLNMISNLDKVEKRRESINKINKYIDGE